MSQTYHIEAIGSEDRGRPPAIQRISIRSNSLDGVRQRAVRLLQRSQAPQWHHGKVEAVRVLDGAGSEVFRWSIWDEMTTPAGR